MILNDTDQEIEIFLVDHNSTGNDVLAMTLLPGGSLEISGQLIGHCTENVLLATSADDEEVERREPGLCEGEVWRVNGNPDD